MKGTSHIRVLTGLILSLAVGAAVLYCGEKDATTAERSMIIVYASGEARIVTGENEAPAKVGMVIKENDTIKTTTGTVDLQTPSGSAVRIKNFTTVTVASLYGEGKNDTQLDMQHGGLMASVKKASAEESFSVSTPTAIAGVRGTTFSVEAFEGESPRVRVLDGKVAMAPRVKALEQFSEEEIEGNEQLRTLRDRAQQSEVVVEESQEAEIDREISQKLEEANRRVSEAGEEVDKTAAAEAAAAALASDEAESDKKAVELRDATITNEELAERATLVTVDPEIAARASQGDESAVAALQEERQAKQEIVLNQIEEQAKQTELKDEEEIRQHYNRLETLNLKSGEKLTGAVIAQTGSVLVVHTPEGVKRVKTSDVQDITYP